MARHITKPLALSIFTKKPTDVIVTSPGLNSITEALFEKVHSVTLREEQMICRAIEMAWLEGASIISSLTVDTTDMIDRKWPIFSGKARG